MFGFVTKNSTYKFFKRNENEYVYGGVFGDTPHKVAYKRCVVGERAIIGIDNGSYIKDVLTSVVRGYLTAMTI